MPLNRSQELPLRSVPVWTISRQSYRPRSLRATLFLGWVFWLDAARPGIAGHRSGTATLAAAHSEKECEFVEDPTPRCVKPGTAWTSSDSATFASTYIVNLDQTEGWKSRSLSA